VFDFALFELCYRLHASHDPDRFRKCRYRPIMEVWGRHRDIPQACYSEYVKIGRILGHVGTTLVDGSAAGGDPIVFDDPEFPIHPTPDARAVVACRASSPDERLQAGPRGCG